MSPCKNFRKILTPIKIKSALPPPYVREMGAICQIGIFTWKPCRRAKPGRFGSFSFAMKSRHFGGECSWTLAGKARKYGRFWVFACFPNPGKQSIWRQCPPSTGKQSTKKTAKSSRFYPCTWKPCTFWVQNGFIFGLFALRFQRLWPKSWFS